MYHVAIDIGGTFTDCAVLDDHGHVVAMSKSPSTRANPADGVFGALTTAAEQAGLSLTDFLRQARVLIHGCTVATNAMIERRGAPTGLITTRGHEDAIIIGKVTQKVAGLAERDVLHQARLAKAHPPIVEPECIRGVRERMDAHGEVVAPLVLDDVDAAVDALVAQGVRAIAVSFLWSFLDGRHEQAARERIQQRHPELYVLVSSAVAPVLGEYERTVTTALSAYLGPPVLGYLDQLRARLTEAGYAHGLLVSHCMGGLTTVDEVRQQPLLTLDSGPAGGVLGARHFASLYGETNVLCTDMGGTSFDVSLIEHGEFSLHEEPVLDKYTFLVPKIAIASIGAGGGSIIWLDPDGIPRVGPQSAGAEPGPACYDRGGTRATITDANLLLGYLNPEGFVGGRRRLRLDRAEAALDDVARPLDMDRVALAAGAFQIVNAQMADLIRRTTIEQGYDPREFALFAYGGAAPAHAAYYARELRLKRIYIPRHSTVFSALGMLTGGLMRSAQAAHPALFPLDTAARDSLRALLLDLERGVREQLGRDGQVDDVRVRRFAYVKYRLQPRALAVELAAHELDDGPAELLRARFERQYADLYGEGAGYHQAGIELVKVRVDGIAAAVTPSIVPDERAPEPDASAALRDERPVYFVETRRHVATPIYDGDALRFGNLLAGPCIVERMGDTIVIPPAVQAEVDQFGNLILHLGAL